jgi:long-chain acyl-CoA synthetase
MTEVTSMRLGRAQIPPPSESSLLDVLAQEVTKHPASPAFSVVLPNGMNAGMSYAELERDSTAFATFLRSKFDLRPGERVAFLLPNCLGFPVCFYGVLKCGGIPILANPLATERELTTQFAMARVKAICFFDFESAKALAVARQTHIEHRVSVSLASLFPAGKRHMLKTMLAVGRKAPLMSLSAVQLDSAIRKGALSGSRRFVAHAAQPDETAAVVFTGGTTGVNKGVELTHSNLLWNAHQLIEPLRAEGKRPVNRLGALPCFHAFGLIGTLIFVRLGGHNVFVPSPRPPSNLKPALEGFEIHWMEGVPLLYKGMLAEPWFNRTVARAMEVASIGGAAADGALFDGLEAVLGHAPVPGYGMSEASPVISANTMNRPVVKHSVGLPLPNTEIRIVGDSGNDAPQGETGEVWVRGPQVMKGYLDNPVETAKVLVDGWLRTGDVGRINADGTVTLVDRIKDMIIVGGFKVFPSDVESVLRDHPQVEDALVFGVTRADLPGDEMVHAAVVLDKSLGALDEAALRAFCKQKLSGYKVPRSVHIVDEFPKTPHGKPDRKAVKARFVEMER